MVIVYGLDFGLDECGWFVQESNGKNQIFGLGYCNAISNGENDVESYMYDCINNQRVIFRWDDNIDCDGLPDSNVTQTLCDDSTTTCNCVASEQSMCQYVEYKTYENSKCDGSEWDKGAQPVGICFPS